MDTENWGRFENNREHRYCHQGAAQGVQEMPNFLTLLFNYRELDCRNNEEDDAKN